MAHNCPQGAVGGKAEGQSVIRYVDHVHQIENKNWPLVTSQGIWAWEEETQNER